MVAKHRWLIVKESAKPRFLELKKELSAFDANGHDPLEYAPEDGRQPGQHHAVGAMVSNGPFVKLRNVAKGLV